MFDEIPGTNDWPDTPIGGLIVPGTAMLGDQGASALANALRKSIIQDGLVRIRDEVDSSRWQRSVANSRFAAARTRSDLNALLHFGHAIPVSRGLTATYVSNHFPGWTWNGLIAVLDAAGVVSRGGGTLHCNPAVGAVHFDSVDSWLVEWEDGQVTRPGYPPG